MTPPMADSLQRIGEAVVRRRPEGTGVRRMIVHESPADGSPIRTVAPGVAAIGWREVVAALRLEGRGTRP